MDEIPQQEQAPQIAAQEPAPQITQEPHAQMAAAPHPAKHHRTRRHIGLTLFVVAAAFLIYFVYRMTSTGRYDAWSVAIIAFTFIICAYAGGYAISQHRKMLRVSNLAKTVERIGTDLAQEVQSVQRVAKAAVADATNQGKWSRRWSQLKEFIRECKRVFSITKKPNREEFKTIVKIAGIGIGLIGLIGFLVQLLREGLRGLGF
jgi:protein transport protein SEC61 subunit gamma-like protein